MDDRIYFVSKIRELKGILRIPRLYEQYKKQFDEANRLNEITEYQLQNYNHGVSQMKPEQNQISQFETQADTISKTKQSVDIVKQLVTELDEMPNTVATRTLQDVTNDELSKLQMNIEKNQEILSAMGYPDNRL